MKKTVYLSIIIAATVALSCTKTQFNEFEPTTGGAANFTTFISVGNSLTQGYQDGGLHNEQEQQANSFPAIIAKQMGVSFLQPMVEGSGSGYKFLQDLTPTITDVNAASNWGTFGWSAWDKTKKYNNLGVAGIRLTDCVPTVGNALSATINQVITGNNPYGGYQNFGSTASPISYLENIKTSNATFFTNWLGNNDVLGWSLAGGDNGATAIPFIGTISTSDLTPVSIFRNKYDSILIAFKNMGAKGVCATLPDVTSIPYFTTVPHNPISLDAARASTLNNHYATYNNGLEAMVTAGSLSANEAATRKIVFAAGTTNALVILDEDLTDLTGLNAALLSMRQATASDLILLKASSQIGKELTPGDATTSYGITVPFADGLVLTATEVSTVQNHTNLLNAAIRSSAAANGNVPVVDMHAVMFNLQAGMTFNGVTYTTKYIEGGAFSLDGVHPNSRGYAIVANKFIEVINRSYGSNLRPVSVHNYKGIIFP